MKKFLRLLLLVASSSFNSYAGLDGNIIIQGKITKAYSDKYLVSIEDTFKQHFVVPRNKMKYYNKKEGLVTVDLSPRFFMKYQRYCLRHLKGKNRKLCPPSL